MSTFKYIALLLVSTLLLTSNARADDYSVTVDGPNLGSFINRNKVTLGIEVNIDKTWDELSDKEKLIWREFTELTDPKVTPPFPLPNIRNFLRMLNTPEKYRTTDRILREDELLMVVRVSVEGLVEQVEVISGADKESRKLSDSESVLAYVYVSALLKTKFSPAKLNDTPAASAFPMRIRQVTQMQ